MLKKLAIRNVKRSIRDYILYVVTVTLIISLMYAFNCMMFSDVISGMNSHMDDYRSLLVVFSGIVLIAVSWLMNYMTRFMLKKRSKEFGTYLILGMKNSSISKMFFYENVILGTVSLAAGIITGGFIFQFLLALVGAFFGEEYKFDAHFSLSAVLLTIVYFAMIQFIVVIRNNRYLKKMKICDLISAAKVNENVKVKHAARNTVIFILALAAGILSVSKVPIGITFIAVIVFIYGFYMGIPGIMVLLVSKSKRFKYKGMNLFIFRQIASKINTIGFTMGTIAVLFTLALLSGNYAIGLGHIKDEIESGTPFDVCMTSLDADYDFADARKMLSDENWSDKELAYKIYKSDSDKLTKVLIDNEVRGGYFERDTVMKLSDYNALRGFLGLEAVTLNDNEYILHCPACVADVFEGYIKNYPEYTLNGAVCKCREICTEDFAQNGQNGAGFVAVVPDSIAENMQVYYSQYACMTLKPASDELYQKLVEIVPQDSDNWATSGHYEDELDHGIGIESLYSVTGNIMVKNSGSVAELEAAIITVVVSIFYIALVFVCVAMTILAVQQLSDSAQFKFRYKVLSSLGVGEKKQSGLVFRQLLIYFGCPLLIPFVLSMTISIKINSLLMTGTQINNSNYSFFIGATAVFLAVYIVYFAATFFGFKRNIEIG